MEGRGGGVEEKERRRGKRGRERKGGRDRKGGRERDRGRRRRESGQRFRLVLPVVNSGLIFSHVILVVVEVAAWSKRRGREGRRGGEEGRREGREGGREGDRERERETEAETQRVGSTRFQLVVLGGSSGLIF